MKNHLPILFVLSAISFQAAAKSGWEKVRESEGVEVFEKKIGKERAFRGVTILRGTPGQLLQVLHDTERWKHWVENLKGGELIGRTSDGHPVYRQVIGTPFPMKDRVVVYESTTKRLDPRTTVVEMKSVDHPQAKRSMDYVRVEIAYTRYTIEELDKEGLRVTFENLSHAGGKVPKFLSNWAARSYPITLLNGIRSEILALQKQKVPLP